ncbi:hypothetical protein GJV04_10680 [Enterobacteriaceae bacterium RIT714]|nr:hypothetical protein [Enterobacteriaceae bacterium RIT714]
MRMKEHYYDKALSYFKLLEEEYECIIREEERVFSKDSNKRLLIKTKVSNAKK